MTVTTTETTAELIDALRLVCGAADGVGAELFNAAGEIEIGCDRLGVDMPPLWTQIHEDKSLLANHDEARRNAVARARELDQPYLFDIVPGVTEAVVPLRVADSFVGYVCVGPVIATSETTPPVAIPIAGLSRMTMRQFTSILNLVRRAVEPIIESSISPDIPEPEPVQTVPIFTRDRTDTRAAGERPAELVRELFVMARYGRVRDALRSFCRERLNGDPVSESDRSRIFSDILLLADCCGKAGVSSTDIAAWTQHAASSLQTATTSPDIEDVMLELLGSIRRSGRSTNPRHATRLRRIAGYVEKHLGDDLSARHVADSLDLSSRQVVNTVRFMTGEGFVAFVTSLRMARARTMLATSCLSIAEISKRLGFSYESYFSRVFTRHVGEPPTRFRRRMKSGRRTVRR
ncbi:MAG: helix-turn-helix transcriptional regulator [Candidatus Hydrogenedentes bacterium]|nr:helix-turn-helix transcriptional regulator [Candidatus Hydrogenedentota bacterium]